jgi:sortase (surface protein transpeptidase)
VAQVDGHVDTYRDGPGAFFRLDELRSGGQIVMATAGAELSYVVRAIRSYAKEPFPEEVVIRTGESRLVLISCGGPFDRESRRYTDNIVADVAPTGT